MADRSITVRVGADVRGLVNSLKTADKAAQDWGNKTLSYVQRNEQSIGTLSNKVGLLGAGLTGLATLAVKKFADFDAAMSNVAATGDDARASIEDLRDAAIQAGADTQFSATEAAGAIEEMAKAGVSAADILGGGLNGALDLAAAGQLDVAEAAGYASVAMTQFKLSGQDVTHVADLLAAGAGKAMGDVADLGQALKQGGLVAAQTGLSIEETTGALSAFASAGLLGSDAGTSLKTMLQRLTPQSKEAQAQFDELGISAYDAQGNFVGLSNFAGQLQSKMKDLTPEARNAALSVMFGSDAVRAASVLYDEGAAGIEKWITAVDDQGYAAEVAATKMNNLKGDLEQLSGSFETALIGMGEGANGPLRSLVQGLDGAVDRFNGMSDGAKQASFAIAGGGGLVLLAIAGLGKMTVAVSETVTALRNMRVISQATAGRVGALVTAVGRFGGYAAGVAAVATGTGLLVDNLTRGEAVPRANALADALYRMGRDSDVANLNEQFDNFGTFLGMSTVDVQNLGDAIAQAFNPSVTDQVASFFDGIPGVTGYMEKLEDRFTGLDQALASMVQGGNIDQARAAFEVIRGAAEEQGVTLDELRTRFPEYVDALVGAKNAADDTAAAQDGFQISAAAATTSIEDQAEALATLVEAQSKLAGLVLSERDAQRNLEAAYDAVTSAIEENGTTLDITTERGRANQDALDGIAAAGWDLIKAMQANGSTSEELQGTMQATRDRFIEVAGQFGITADEASALADQMGLIPENVNTVAQFTDNASSQIQDFINRWAGKTVTVQALLEINPQWTRGQAADAARYTAQALASGGYAKGGYTGDGGKYEPKGVVHGGEFVVRKEITARHRPMLERLNKGYADGGFVGRQYTTPAYMTSAAAPSMAAVSGGDLFPNATIVAADPGAAVKELGAFVRREMLTVRV